MTYLQPAAESLWAYILPMSPMPISPTTKPAISGGGFGEGDDEFGDGILSIRRRSMRNEEENKTKMKLALYHILEGAKTHPQTLNEPLLFWVDSSPSAVGVVNKLFSVSSR
jgi:hypothetical protein